MRRALVEAALHEFAAHGFDAASTRAIATRAGTHQPQINYHFESSSNCGEQVSTGCSSDSTA
ncbi:MAG: helix-turn-helix domain-containing protein [Acidimicrobiales bacterium]